MSQWDTLPVSKDPELKYYYLQIVLKYFPLQLVNSRTSHFSCQLTVVKESLPIAWQTTHQCTCNIPHTFVFILSIKHRHFFGVTFGCF